MITPRLALMFDGSGIAHQEGNADLVQAVDTFAAQYFATNALWVKGGIGIARVGVSVDGHNEWVTPTGMGLLLAAGYEVYQRDHSALDLQLRLASGSYDGGTITNVSLLVGYNWY
jgi:hypothetical protein